MNFVVPDFYPAAAEIFVAVMALVTLMAVTFIRSIARDLAYFLTQATLIGAALIVYFTMNGQVSLTFSNLFIDDPMGDALKIFVCFTVAVALLYGKAYLSDRRIDRPEYYLLAQLMTLGMMVMISANHMLTIYMGLEMMTLSLYAMIAFDRDSVRSTEASMKYFVLGALASGLLLYGMSMVYGATGSLDLPGIAQAVDAQSANRPVLLFGLVFLMAGIAFKFGVVPFHMWVPDVYHGASTALTLIVSTAPKLAAFAMAMRLLVSGLPGLADQWQGMLMFLAVASIVLGNLAAIVQNNIKRMLAYSGISHMGFVLLGLLSGVVEGSNVNMLNAYSSAMFYAVSYVLMTLAAFSLIVLLSRSGYEAESISDFKGLNKRNSWFAAIMMFVMFSMAGIPFFVGFFAKLAVLQSVIAAGYVWLAVVAVLMSVVGAFYYLRVIKVMYFDEPEDSSPIRAPMEVQVFVSANGLAIVLFGLLPYGLMELCTVVMRHSLI